MTTRNVKPVAKRITAAAGPTKMQGARGSKVVTAPKPAITKLFRPAAKSSTIPVAKRPNTTGLLAYITKPSLDFVTKPKKASKSIGEAPAAAQRVKTHREPQRRV